MRNKKAGITGEIISLVIILLMIVGALVFLIKVVPEGYQEYKQMKAYKSFCEDKTDFCYCELFSRCVFKTSWSSKEGLSEDTKELCKLANELNDKETLFKSGCNQ